MKFHYLVLVLLAFTAFIPVTAAIDSQSHSMIFSDGSSIDPQLERIFSDSDHPSGQEVGSHRVLLQFADELSAEEIVFAESIGLTFERHGSSVINVGCIYSGTLSSRSSLNALSSLGLVRVSSGEKQYVPAISSSVPAIRAPDVWENLRYGGDAINGTGVRVAVIDTGIAFFHPSFWKQSSGEYDVIQSGPNFYVDLDGDSVVDENEGPINHIDIQLPESIEVSNEYMYIDHEVGGFQLGDGDIWLGGVDSNSNNRIDLPAENVVLLNESKVELLYDQFTGLVYQRGVNLTSAYSISDYHGHGSHIASTIAGGQPGFTSYVGVAPGADLVIIRSPLASSDVLDGIHFAVEVDADIINMSFSSYLGFLDGTDLEDLAITEAFLKHGVLTTTAAGNMGSLDKHAYFSVPSASEESATLDVYLTQHSILENSPFVSVLWQSDNDDEHVIFTPPEGDPIDMGAFSEIVGGSFVVENPSLNAYMFADVSLRGMNNVLVQASTNDHNWTSGDWQIGLENPSGGAVTVDVYAWDGDWDHTYLEFIDKVDHARTISSPGTSDLAITVANYNEGSGIYSTSSRGPRIDGAPKPTVAAPGVNIQAASLRLTDPNTLWISRGGTSMASPHVAGILALIRQSSGADSGWKEYTALVAGAGATLTHYENPDPSWGHGLCDALWSVQHVNDANLDIGSTLNEWVGYPNFLSSPILSSIEGALDIRSVKVHQSVDEFGVAVTFRDVPDFSSDNLLSLRWNTDNNLGTGSNGYDLLVNVTGGTSVVYEWNGSSFIPSSLTSDSWTNSYTAFIRVDRTPSIVRGTISLMTGNTSLALADETSVGLLVNQWSPLVANLIVDYSSTQFTISLTLDDEDSSIAEYAAFWNVRAGNMSLILSDEEFGLQTVEIIVNRDLLDSASLSSIWLNISDSEISYVLPPVILTTSDLTEFSIVSAYLDQSEVRVGPFLNQILTGRIVVEGYALVEEVRIEFRAVANFTVGLALDGVDGVYNVSLIPSIPGGRYEVYALAIGFYGETVELHMGSLLVVEDNSVVVLIAIIAIAVIVVAYNIPRLITRFRGEG
ncbi:MAG: S8 family serine peptidase [Promethearchaeota archaeon]